MPSMTAPRLARGPRAGRRKRGPGPTRRELATARANAPRATEADLTLSCLASLCDAGAAQPVATTQQAQTIASRGMPRKAWWDVEDGRFIWQEDLLDLLASGALTS
jgi:hypothetical protein